MPEGWKLPPITQHPCLLFGPEEFPVLRTNLVAEFGSLEHIGDETLTACLAGNAPSRRKATEDFITSWKSYSRRWAKENLDRPKPDGVSMRGIWRCIYLYDIVDGFGLLSEAQRNEFRDRVVQAIHWSLGPDKGHRRVPLNSGWRSMNIYSDVVIAGGTVGLAFPDLPEARDWIELATGELDWQLDNAVWDGAWNESPRYQAHVLKTAGLYFQSLKRRTGVDMFQHPTYQAMLDWLVRFETPPDRAAGNTLGRAAGVALIPGIGDSSWTEVPLGLCAMFAPQYAQNDPHFAARLMWAWNRGGRPYDGAYGGDGLEWARVLINPLLTGEPQSLGSDSSAGKGYVVMRGGVDEPDEVWFLLRCGRRTLAGHDHADWNAFNLYAFGYPLALDAGSGIYSQPEHKAWHDKAIAHNTVVFGGRSQERRDGKILTFVTRPEADYSVSDASVPAGVEKFDRHVLFVKPDYFVIWDEIKARERAAWTMHTTATDFIWSEHGVRCTTPWQTELDVHVVLPDAPLKPGVKKGRFGAWTEENGTKDNPLPFYHEDYFQIPNAAGENFLTILHPRKPGQAALTFQRGGTAAAPVLEITCGEQKDRVELGSEGAVLNRKGAKNVSLVLKAK